MNKVSQERAAKPIVRGSSDYRGNVVLRKTRWIRRICEPPRSGCGTPHATSRAALLDVIRGAGQISRVDLARETGLTGATVSTVVRRLIDDGLVVEVGRAESTGGKPAVLLSLEPEARYAIGVHLDHGGITYVIADLGGAVVSRWRRPGAGGDAPDAVVDRVASELRTLVDQAGVDPERILGLGVVSPGPDHPDDRVGAHPAGDAGVDRLSARRRPADRRRAARAARERRHGGRGRGVLGRPDRRVQLLRRALHGHGHRVGHHRQR